MRTRLSCCALCLHAGSRSQMAACCVWSCTRVCLCVRPCQTILALRLSCGPCLCPPYPHARQQAARPHISTCQQASCGGCAGIRMRMEVALLRLGHPLAFTLWPAGASPRGCGGCCGARGCAGRAVRPRRGHFAQGGAPRHRHPQPAGEGREPRGRAGTGSRGRVPARRLPAWRPRLAGEPQPRRGHHLPALAAPPCCRACSCCWPAAGRPYSARTAPCTSAGRTAAAASCASCCACCATPPSGQVARCAAPRRSARSLLRPTLLVHCACGARSRSPGPPLPPPPRPRPLGFAHPPSHPHVHPPSHPQAHPAAAVLLPSGHAAARP